MWLITNDRAAAPGHEWSIVIPVVHMSVDYEHRQVQYLNHYRGVVTFLWGGAVSFSHDSQCLVWLLAAFMFGAY